MLANFRDLGGLIGFNNLQVKKGIFFRSASLDNLTSEEIHHLLSLKIRTIVDFRNENEKKEKPDTLFTNVSYVPIDIFGSSANYSPDVKTMMTNLEQADTLMENVYVDLVLSKQAQEKYRQFLHLLLEKDTTPFVFHCTFGKDRTGYAAALILKILGVSEKDILTNYLNSNQSLAQFNQHLLNEMKQKLCLSEQQLNQIKPLLQVNQKHLALAFQTINDNYQNFNNYLQTILAFDADKVNYFRSNYLTNQ